ncbi:hypothetical protein BAV0972 [Bordetella avium 197N]|uniref:Uncharacterized protein n=1 Tax=Bordetella avium (strain 197N) TaxID=360910 RepID=Q2KVH2_BORA1|nr:hypothetical protein BAV0972 [Bordetella avium 197N]
MITLLATNRPQPRTAASTPNITVVPRSISAASFHTVEQTRQGDGQRRRQQQTGQLEAKHPRRRSPACFKSHRGGGHTTEDRNPDKKLPEGHSLLADRMGKRLPKRPQEVCSQIAQPFPVGRMVELHHQPHESNRAENQTRDKHRPFL